MNNKHLTLSDRIRIEELLNKKQSFRQIAKEINVSHTTVSREVKSRLLFKQSGAWGNAFNDCIHRFHCTVSSLCDEITCKRRTCKSCSKCFTLCKEYQKQTCTKLFSAPFVCNGCEDRRKCTLEKRFYEAKFADNEYRTLLSEYREGINLSKEEFRKIDQIIYDALKKGQSLYAIHQNNKDVIMHDVRTLYNYVNKGILSVSRMDQPRAVKFKKRKGSTRYYKSDKACLEGRKYEDFLSYISKYPDRNIVEIDTVIGRVGGKTLLTIHFTEASFMIGYLLESNTSQEVINAFNDLYYRLGKTHFKQLFHVILTDNGSEFSNPSKIEFDDENKRRTRIFYCHPYSSYEKPHVEKNHVFVRRILPRGTSFDDLTQEDIDSMFHHINSYVRKKLGNKAPYQVFQALYGQKKLEKIGFKVIPHNDIILNKSLLTKR